MNNRKDTKFVRFIRKQTELYFEAGSDSTIRWDGEDVTKTIGTILRTAAAAVILLVCTSIFGTGVRATANAQEPAPAKSGTQTADNKNSAAQDSKSSQAYSGMYSFLKEGEFVQVTVEDDGEVTGFVSRFGDGESDKGVFLDQFFKTAKLEGKKLTFTTEIVHGVSFEFKGTVERGAAKTAGDEGYFVLQGQLTENVSDANKKVTSQSRDVAFKSFPEEASSQSAK